MLLPVASINKTYVLYIDIVDEAGGIATIATILAMDRISVSRTSESFTTGNLNRAFSKLSFMKQNAMEKGMYTS